MTQKAFVSLDESTRTLRVFLQDIAFDQQSIERELSIMIDHDRYDDEAPIGANVPDRRYTINLLTQEASVTTAVTALPGQTLTQWVPATDAGFAVDSRCEQEPNGKFIRCDVEYRIQLLRADLISPGPDLLPGIGFAISDHRRGTAFPEEIHDAESDRILFDRSQYATLLFGPPVSIPFSFMTWNVAHWGTALEYEITGSPFGPVSMDNLASMMTEYDIVAIQEMWSRDDAQVLLANVNTRRSRQGLPEAFLYGPASASPDDLLNGRGNLTGDPQAGVFIISHFRAIDSGYELWDECRGEDCFKPKGAQWVRLALADPTERDISEECASKEREPDAGCGPTPTTAIYVDVFNAHFQADAEIACSFSDVEIAALIAAVVSVCGVLPDPVVCTAALVVLSDAQLYCPDYTDRQNRALQLAQLDRYVQSIVGEDNDHPSLVVGDFNIDGRRFDGTDDMEYIDMLSELQLLTDEGVDGEPSAVGDRLSPFPDAFEWDIDHADVAREETRYLWDSVGHGTSISHGGWDDDGNRFLANDRTPLAPPGRSPCDLLKDGPNEDRTDSRLDYFLVRPPVRRDDARDPIAYMISRDPLADSVWEPLWPAFVDLDSDGLADIGADLFHQCGDFAGNHNNATGLPRRLSDHRPTVGHFSLSVLRQPGRYHPEWSHRVYTRVTSVDVSAVSDCVRDACGPADPFVRLEGFRFTPSNERENAPGEINLTRCNNIDKGSLSWPRHACMNAWFYRSQVIHPGEYARSEVAWRLREADSLIFPDDEIYTIALEEGGERDDHPNFHILWDSAEFDIKGRDDSEGQPSNWSGPVPILSSDPIRWCTGEGSPSICVSTEIQDVSL